MRVAAAIGRQRMWQAALTEAVSQMTPPAGGGQADLAFLFASAAYAEEFPHLVAAARRAVGARLLVGCSGQGVIGPGREVEGEPALAILAATLPDAALRAVRLTQGTLERCRNRGHWYETTGVAPTDLTAWILFADPFTFDAD
ncbi:MAG TPA: FIST N-terminal domain-containing protein, partial [bacterium]